MEIQLAQTDGKVLAVVLENGKRVELCLDSRSEILAEAANLIKLAALSASLDTEKR